MKPRFEVRPSHLDGHPTVWSVYDTQHRRYVDTYSRPQIAEMAVRRLNAEWSAWRARVKATP